MAKIGIVCDNYKVGMFEQELKAAGVNYTIEEGINLPTGLTAITCISEQRIIGPITDKVTRYWEDHIKQSKNN